LTFFIRGGELARWWGAGHFGAKARRAGRERFLCRFPADNICGGINA